MSGKIRLLARKRRPARPVSVGRTWERLEKWFERRLPEVLGCLRSGATPIHIQSFEKAIGNQLPECVRESYLIHNGQNRWPDVGLVFGLGLLSLEHSLDEWQWWKKDRETTAPGEAVPYEGRSFPEGAIQLEYENTGWIPVGADAGGNYLGIDLSPGPNGSVGQVINFGRDEQTKCVLALSWGQFLKDIADELKVGNFLIENEREEKRFALRSPNHFFNYCVPWSRAKLGLVRLTGADAQIWKQMGWKIEPTA